MPASWYITAMVDGRLKCMAEAKVLCVPAHRRKESEGMHPRILERRFSLHAGGGSGTVTGGPLLAESRPSTCVDLALLNCRLM